VSGARTDLQEALPELRLALGERIDVEGNGGMPPRYARALPPARLVVTLRPDVAQAAEPIAADLERDLTDACNRHGSLYDRRYRVELQAATDSSAPLWSVSLAPAAATGAGEAGSGDPSRRGDGSAPDPAGAASPSPGEEQAPHAGIPVVEEAGGDGWDPERWVLLVEEEEGRPDRRLRIERPQVVVGRATDDTALRPDLPLPDLAHVSRRHLALRWEPRDGAPGFRVHNLGKNPVHLDAESIPGAAHGRGALDLASVPEASTGWLAPGASLRIGEGGPWLRVMEAGEPQADPDATVFG
jgi:hypothetical protein